MSRSPLTAVLRHVAARVHRDVGGDRVEPADARRRTVLGGAAAFAGLSALGLHPVLGQTATARIAVVGAGLAGLTAAYRLKQHGFSPVLLEANTRLGGRCYTARGIFEDGQIAEHGGEFIDSDHKPTIALVKELGLVLDDVSAAEPAGVMEKYRFNGQPYDLKAATADYQPLYPIVQKQNAAIGDTISYQSSTEAAKRFDAMTLRQWIEAYVPGGCGSKLGQLIDNAFAEENAADTSLQSALNVIYTLAADAKDNFNLYYTGSDQRFHVRGGNDQIATRLGGLLAGAVQTGVVLTAITQLGDGRVRLTLRRGTALRDETFDRVVFALPFSVMRAAVDFSQAGFRPLKQRAIRELGMGASVKTQVQVRRRLWNELGCNGEIRLASRWFQTSWDVTRAQAGTKGIFNFWSGGSQAAADGEVDQRRLVAACFADAEQILPGLGGLWNGLASVDVWKRNPWSLGSYSFYGPGYQTTLYGIEKKPETNSFFAGEHTWSQAGYLNAGVASGERAARQVLRSLVA